MHVVSLLHVHERMHMCRILRLNGKFSVRTSKSCWRFNDRLLLDVMLCYKLPKLIFMTVVSSSPEYSVVSVRQLGTKAVLAPRPLTHHVSVSSMSQLALLRVGVLQMFTCHSFVTL